jgi:drug/metabolite transporter (DMT)-like permease
LGAGGVPQKTILAHLDPFTVTGLTCLIGALVILPMARREGRTRDRTGPGMAAILAVALPFTIGVTLAQVGYGLTSVTNAGFFTNTAAVLTPFAAWVLHRHRPQTPIFLASGVTCFGLFLMGGGIGEPAAGDAVCFLAAVAFLVWMVALGDHVVRFGNPNGITCLQLAVAGAVSMALGVGVHGVPASVDLLAALPELLMIGVLSKGLAYCLNSAAQQHLHPASIAVLVSAEAVFGSLFAVVLINERLSAMQAAGASLVICGIIAVARMQMPAHAALTSTR